MKAAVYRLNRLEGHGSWRPRSLVDMRGDVYPDEYHELLALDTQGLTHLDDEYPCKLGDIVFLGEGADMVAYVAAPFGWEMVKFGAEWKSPS